MMRKNGAGDGQPENKKRKSGRRKKTEHRAAKAAVELLRESLLLAEEEQYEKDRDRSRMRDEVASCDAHAALKRLVETVDEEMEQLEEAVYVKSGSMARDDVGSGEESDNDREEAIEVAAGRRKCGKGSKGNTPSASMVTRSRADPSHESSHKNNDEDEDANDDDDCDADDNDDDDELHNDNDEDGAGAAAAMFSVERAREQVHRHQQRHPCKCKDRNCYFAGWEDVALSMRMMDQVGRAWTVKAMLLGMAAPPGRVHDLLIEPGKKNRSVNATAVLFIRGRRVCTAAFDGIMQISTCTRHRFQSDVTRSARFEPPVSKRARTSARTATLHTLIAKTFLNRYAVLHGRICPSGRRFANGHQLRALEAGIKRKAVYQKYCKDFPVPPAIPKGERPTPLSLTGFVTVWRRNCTHIKLAKPGSDWCEYCSTMCKSQRLHAWQDLTKHREYARAARGKYKELRDGAPGGDYFHAVFDFAEKLLLPLPLRQPGWVFYTTGLKLDIFGVSISNTQKHIHYALTEGHWPNTKGPDSVLSMLHDTLRRPPARSHERVRLHADNCGGQNKNHYSLYYLALRTIVGLNTDIELHFMIAGHTKSAPDAYFGLAKKHIRQTDAITPEDVSHERVCDSVWGRGRERERERGSRRMVLSWFTPQHNEKRVHPHSQSLCLASLRLCDALNDQQETPPLPFLHHTCAGCSGSPSWTGSSAAGSRM